MVDLLDDFKDDPEAGPVRRCLITRESSVTKRIFNAFKRRGGDGIYVVDPVFSSNDALDDGDTFGYVNRDVHAKVFFTEKYNEPKKLYIGSLNASQNAFDHNVEFLLELQYKSYHASYFSVKDDFIPAEESPFVPMTDFKEELIEQEEEQVDFRDEVYGVTGAKVISRDGQFDIEVYAADDYEGVTIRPFYVKTQTKTLMKVTRFEDISLNSFTDKPQSKAPRLRVHFAAGYFDAKTSDKTIQRVNNVRNAFNSPFRPFVLATTSVGQEGLDFHLYSRKVVHWNLPSNPIDVGRILRTFKIKKNVEVTDNGKIII